MDSGENYWTRYFDRATLDRAAKIRRVERVESTGVALHVDVYEQDAADAPVLVVAHGGGGYGGLFVALALAFHARGYTVVVPDQRGQGRSGGPRGDFTIAEAVENVVDIARWAKDRFDGALLLGGASIGGGLAYYASAVLAGYGVPPAAVFCLDLYDFGDTRTAISFTRAFRLADLPALATLSSFVSRILAGATPELRVPYRPLARFAHLFDARDVGTYALWCRDPCTLTTVTMRHLASLSNTPPLVSFEDHRDVPILVLNQTRDQMVRPRVTQRSAKRLAGPKHYVEIDWGHFSMCADFSNAVAGLSDDWFRSHLPPTAMTAFTAGS